MKKDYANAFISALEKGVEIDIVLSGLKKSLASRHHEALYLPVLHEVLKRLQKDKAEAGAVVKVAKEIDAKSDLVKKQLAVLGVTEAPQVVLDETVIGGAIVSYRHRMVDASYKRALTKLYRAITK